jgi:hypothetical protein
MIIPGGGGSGKTVFILSALKKGWKLFAAEFVHFTAGKKLRFYKGAIRDAVRVDTFRDHFPEMADKLNVDLKEETGSKLVVDFSPFQFEDYVLDDPEIILAFPHVEEKRSKVIHSEVKDRETILRNLFNSASEKLGKSILLYGKFAVPGLDTMTLAQKRMENLETFLTSGNIERSFVWVSGVREVINIV